ncbi:MAG: class I SAM-dependent methyltransferase [bacterium]
MNTETGEKEWYEDWFDETYLLLYRHRDQAEAQRLIRWVAERVDDRLPNHYVLDIGCGAGRHARAMSGIGWSVTGVDLSRSMLKHAKEQNVPESTADKTLPIHYVRADLRRLPFSDQTFGLALNAFTSFGYFQADTEHRRAFSEFARVLVPGGVLVLDLLNPETAIRDLVPHDIIEEGGLRAVQTRHFNPVDHRIEKHVRIAQPSGTIREVFESVRLFTQEEISELAGWRTLGNCPGLAPTTVNLSTLRKAIG